MKKNSCLSCLGIVFLIIFAVAVSLFTYAYHMGSKLDASSKAYVDEAVPLIVRTWDKAELEKRSSPELKKASTEDDITKLFAKFNQAMGPFVKYNGSTGDSKLTFEPKVGKTIIATYKAETEFQRGKATIDIKLIQHDNQWKILSFYVNMPVSAL